MKKLLLFLLIIGIYLPLSGAEKIYFIPGWYSKWNFYYKHIKILKTISPDSEVKICRWNSNRLWGNAKKSADEYSGEFAGQLLKEPETENIILIGHSLGGRIVLDIAEELARNKRKVRRLILLGAAGEIDAEDMDHCRRVSILPVINIYCPDDSMLKLYLLKEHSAPLGYVGLPQKTVHFQQYRMPVPDYDIKIGKFTVIKAEVAEIFRETSAHLAKKYLQTLAAAMNGEISESYPSETP